MEQDADPAAGKQNISLLNSWRQEIPLISTRGIHAAFARNRKVPGFLFPACAHAG